MIKKEIIAVDIGGTNLRIALLKNNNIIRLIKKKTPKTKAEIIKIIFDSISKLMNKNIRGIGIGSPGPLKNGVIIRTPNLPFRNFNLKEIVRKKFKVRVEVENDANCVALAEARFGVRKKNFFVLTFGTGVGGGVIIDGKLYSRGGLGGELGHIYLSKEKDFEGFVASKAIKKLTNENFGRKINFSELIKMNNEKANKILDKIAGYCGQGIGSLINIFDPEIIVLAGGFIKAGDKFLNLIRKKAKKYIFLPGNFPIVKSKLEEPGVLGASLLID